MKMNLYNCAVFAVKTTLDGTKLGIEPDLAIYLLEAESEEIALREAERKYKSLPDKIEYDQLSVFSVQLRAGKLVKVLEGEVLKLALRKLEVFDELDAEIIS